jgi:hypothetical protein
MFYPLVALIWVFGLSAYEYFVRIGWAKRPVIADITNN